MAITDQGHFDYILIEERNSAATGNLLFPSVDVRQFRVLCQSVIRAPLRKLSGKGLM
jgi:hypothetical protein